MGSIFYIDNVVQNWSSLATVSKVNCRDKMKQICTVDLNNQRILNIGKSSRSSSVIIHWDINIRYWSILPKQTSQLFLPIIKRGENHQNQVPSQWKSKWKYHWFIIQKGVTWAYTALENHFKSNCLNWQQWAAAVHVHSLNYL